MYFGDNVILKTKINLEFIMLHVFLIIETEEALIGEL